MLVGIIWTHTQIVFLDAKFGVVPYSLYSSPEGKCHIFWLEVPSIVLQWCCPLSQGHSYQYIIPAPTQCNGTILRMLDPSSCCKLTNCNWIDHWFVRWKSPESVLNSLQLAVAMSLTSPSVLSETEGNRTGSPSLPFSAKTISGTLCQPKRLITAGSLDVLIPSHQILQKCLTFKDLIWERSDHPLGFFCLTSARRQATQFDDVLWAWGNWSRNWEKRLKKMILEAHVTHWNLEVPFCRTHFRTKPWCETNSFILTKIKCFQVAAFACEFPAC